MAYLTLFPIGGTMRANLAIYRNMDDPWLRQFRQAPEANHAGDDAGAAPRWPAISRSSGPIKIRPGGSRM